MLLKYNRTPPDTRTDRPDTQVVIEHDRILPRLIRLPRSVKVHQHRTQSVFRFGPAEDAHNGSRAEVKDQAFPMEQVDGTPYPSRCSLLAAPRYLALHGDHQDHLHAFAHGDAGVLIRAD